MILIILKIVLQFRKSYNHERVLKKIITKKAYFSIKSIMRQKDNTMTFFSSTLLTSIVWFSFNNITVLSIGERTPCLHSYYVILNAVMQSPVLHSSFLI